MDDALRIIVGPKGDTGPQGEPGPQGEQGVPGEVDMTAVDATQTRRVLAMSTAGRTWPAVTTDAPTLSQVFIGGTNVTPLSGTIRTLAHNTPEIGYWGLLPLDNNFGSAAYPQWERLNRVNAGKNGPFAIRFETDAQEFTVKLRTTLTNFSWWLFVDGAPTTVNATSFKETFSADATMGGSYWVKMAFSSAKNRRIELHLVNASFRGMELPVTASIAPSPAPAVKLVAGFDSLTDGALGLTGLDTWALRLARLAGVELFHCASGGRGYAVRDGGGWAKVDSPEVLNPIIEVKPDFVWLAGSVNDAPVGLYEAARHVFDTLLAGTPRTRIIVSGPQQTNIAGMSAESRGVVRDNLRRAALESPNVVAFFDEHFNTTATEDWAANKHYLKGNTVRYMGAVYVATQEHDSTATFNPAMWGRLGWLTGTGYTGGVKGDGNRDVALGSDNVHWTRVGHEAVARYRLSRWHQVMNAKGMVDEFAPPLARPTNLDPQPPAPPVASLSALSSNGARLTWGTVPGGVTAVYVYERRSATDGATWSAWGKALTRDPSSTSYDMLNRAAGTTYEWYVTYLNSVGESGQSNAVSFKAA